MRVLDSFITTHELLPIFRCHREYLTFGLSAPWKVVLRIPVEVLSMWSTRCGPAQTSQPPIEVPTQAKDPDQPFDHPSSKKPPIQPTNPAQSRPFESRLK